MSSHGFTWVHLGSLGFTWVDLVGSGRLGIKLVILEAQEMLRQTDRQTDRHTHRGFVRCTEILSQLMRVNVEFITLTKFIKSPLKIPLLGFFVVVGKKKNLMAPLKSSLFLIGSIRHPATLIIYNKLEKIASTLHNSPPAEYADIVDFKDGLLINRVCTLKFPSSRVLFFV